MIAKLKSQKEIAGLVVFVIVSTVGALAWATSNFITSASAQVTHSQMKAESARADKVVSNQILALTKEVKESNGLLLVHLDRYSLDKVKSDIKTNKSETFSLEQFIRINGLDSQSDLRLQSLTFELGDLELKKTCIINNNPLCD